MRPSPSRSWSLGLVGLVACATTEPPPADAVEWLPADSYCERTAGLFCDFYLRCGWVAAADAEGCSAIFIDGCEGRWEPLYVALADAGLIALRAAGVEACAAHLASVPCGEQATDLSGPCRGMWEGRQPAGGACGMGAGGLESLVCAPAGRCTLDLSFCGSCTSTVGLGESCELDRDCDAAAACVAQRCQARVLPGGPCGAEAPCVSEASCENEVCALRHVKQPEDGACQSLLDCQYGLTCVGGSCRPTARLGEPCDAATPCAAGRCDGGRCVSLLGAGEPCTAHGDCLSGSCGAAGCAGVPGACFAL